MGTRDAVAPAASGGLARATKPGVVLPTDGDHRASDGHNAAQGRWAASDGGALLATNGVSTLIGCPDVDVAPGVGEAASADFAGSPLVLVDGSGHELGRPSMA